MTTYYVVDTTLLSLLPVRCGTVEFDSLAEAMEYVGETIEHDELCKKEFEVRVGDPQSANVVRIDSLDYEAPDEG
jgi:hypothetical protein